MTDNGGLDCANRACRNKFLYFCHAHDVTIRRFTINSKTSEVPEPNAAPPSSTPRTPWPRSGETPSVLPPGNVGMRGQWPYAMTTACRIMITTTPPLPRYYAGPQRLRFARQALYWAASPAFQTSKQANKQPAGTAGAGSRRGRRP